MPVLSYNRNFMSGFFPGICADFYEVKAWFQVTNADIKGIGVVAFSFQDFGSGKVENFNP